MEFLRILSIFVACHATSNSKITDYLDGNIKDQMFQSPPELLEGQIAHLEAQIEPVADPRLKVGIIN